MIYLEKNRFHWIPHNIRCNKRTGLSVQYFNIKLFIALAAQTWHSHERMKTKGWQLEFHSSYFQWEVCCNCTWSLSNKLKMFLHLKKPLSSEIYCSYFGRCCWFSCCWFVSLNDKSKMLSDSEQEVRNGMH